MSTIKFNNVENFVTGPGRIIPAARDMSLRDYFAAHASEDDVATYRIYGDPGLSREQAKYLYADAMLEARGL